MPYYGKVLSELLYLEVYVLRNQKNDNQKGPCKKYSDMKNSKSTKPVNLKIDTHLSLSNLNITLKFYENVLKLFVCHRKCYCLLNIKNSKSNNSVIPKIWKQKGVFLCLIKVLCIKLMKIFPGKLKSLCAIDSSDRWMDRQNDYYGAAAI